MHATPLFPGNPGAHGTVDLVVDAAVAHVSLNWPEKRNAMRYSMWASLAEHFGRIGREDGLIAVVISGADPSAFAAGADIGELASCLDDRDRAAAYMGMTEAALLAIADCPLPVIAAIRGFCIGAGLEIAMACDVRLATTASQFGAPPARLGANYSFESTKRLIDLVGPGTSRRMLFTGCRLSGPEALARGLVDHCSDEIDTQLAGLIETLGANSPYSITVAKRTIRDIERGAQTESAEIRDLRLGGFAHGDLREGIESFLQKRPPRFRDPSRSRMASREK